MPKVSKKPILQRQNAMPYTAKQFPHIVDIGGNKRVKVQYWNGENRIDIRQWFKAENDILYPTKKGISLTTRRFKTLLEYTDYITGNVIHGIQEAIRLGGNIYAMTSTNNVHIRKYFMPSTNHSLYLPSKFGVNLSGEEWMNLKNNFSLIADNVPDMDTVFTCKTDPEHQRPEVALACLECNHFPLNVDQIANLMKELNPNYGTADNTGDITN